jgi:predicted nucleic acid-binding protein
LSFIVDASVAACWAFRDESDPRADAAFELLRRESALVPSLWWYEIRNVILVNERRGRILQPHVDVFLHEIGSMEIIADLSADESAICALARKHRLTFYDATYLELACRERLPLATLDNALAASARRERVDLVGTR